MRSYQLVLNIFLLFLTMIASNKWEELVGKLGTKIDIITLDFAHFV